MSRILARLVLAGSTVMATPIVYFIVFIVLESAWRGNDRGALAFAGLLSIAFFSTAWILAWRAEITWTPHRRQLTALSILCSLGVATLVAVVVALMVGSSEAETGLVVGAMVWWIVWMPSTAFIWRETGRERTARLDRGAGPTLPCPDCGYDLTGLYEARCPECGARFTLDQLFSVLMRSDSELPDDTSVAPSSH